MVTIPTVFVHASILITLKYQIKYRTYKQKYNRKTFGYLHIGEFNNAHNIIVHVALEVGKLNLTPQKNHRPSNLILLNFLLKR